MSKLDTKARSKRVKVDQNRMIPRFFQRPDRAAGSFVSDLDTIGIVGEIMNTALAQYPCASPPLGQENWRSDAVAERPLRQD